MRINAAITCICLALSVAVFSLPRRAIENSDEATSIILGSIETAILATSVLNAAFALLIFVMAPGAAAAWLVAAMILPVLFFGFLPAIQTA